ncbi:MAG: hypothetical protein ACHQUC_07750 [Chlamydiales bacterium]
MEKSTGIDPGLRIILEKAPSEELEYGFVMECLNQYQNPRVKLNHLLKIGALVRVKKGIYIFGKLFARGPYCSEVLANMIYGPSYVSLEWACQYWNLIPERVYTVTSVTTKRTKLFNTPIGTFTYDHLPISVYPVGVTYIRFSDKQHALVATKEKALVDLLLVRRGFIASMKNLQETLFEDLRVEETDLSTFDLDLIEQIHQVCSQNTTKLLLQLIKKRKQNHE